MRLEAVEATGPDRTRPEGTNERTNLNPSTLHADACLWPDRHAAKRGEHYKAAGACRLLLESFSAWRTHRSCIGLQQIV